MSHKLELLPWGRLSFHWLTCRINDPNYCVFLSNHVLHFGCEGLWHRGRHLTCLPFGTGMSSLAIGQHPRVQLFFFFWPRFCSNQKECQWEAPSALTPPPPHLTFTCAIGQKRASVPPRAPRGPILWCTACLMGSNTPLQSCTPAPHTITSIIPHPGQIKPSHSLQWVNEWVNANKQMNTLQQLSVSDLGLNTQTQSVYTVWHLRQLFLIEYCGIGSDKRKLIHVSREPVTTLFTVDLSGELY